MPLASARGFFPLYMVRRTRTKNVHGKMGKSFGMARLRKCLENEQFPTEKRSPDWLTWQPSKTA